MALAYDLVRSGEIIALSRDVGSPFYRAKAERTTKMLRGALDGLDFYIHESEGAFFLWGSGCATCPFPVARCTNGSNGAASWCCQGTSFSRGWKGNGATATSACASATRRTKPWSRRAYASSRREARAAYS